MKTQGFLGLLLAAGPSAASLFSIRGREPTAFRAASPDVVTDNYVPIRKVSSKTAEELVFGQHVHDALFVCLFRVQFENCKSAKGHVHDS